MADQQDAPASDWPDVSPAGLRKMAEIAAPNNGAVFRAAADEIERLAAQPVAQAPEGWKLVPLSSLENIRDSLRDYQNGHAYSAEFDGANLDRLDRLIEGHATAPSPEASKPVQAEAPSGYLPIREDETERRYFDLATETYGGDVRANINLTLRQFAAQRPGGSFAATLHIIANEVLKLHTMPAAHSPASGAVEREALTDAQLDAVMPEPKSDLVTSSAIATGGGSYGVKHREPIWTKAEVRAAMRAALATQPLANEWKEAVLDQLAAVSMDAPLSEPPASILKRVIAMAVQMATDPAIATQPLEKHPDSLRCIEARNKLNAAMYGEGVLIDDLEHAVASACVKLATQPLEQKPVESNLSVLMELNAFRAGLFGLCQGPEPKSLEEALVQLRNRLRRKPPAAQPEQVAQDKLDAERWRAARGEFCNTVWCGIGAGESGVGLDDFLDTAIRDRAARASGQEGCRHG